MKNAFYFMLKVLFVLEIFIYLFIYLFTFFFFLFDYVENQLDRKAKFNFKIYYVTDWTTNIQ